MNITIKKGHDIQISGVPSGEIGSQYKPEKVALLPIEFRCIKPKLLVKEGDQVQIGSPLFFNKSVPKIKWASPGGGIVSEIKFGPRRVIEKVEIELDKHENKISMHQHSEQEISRLTREIIIDTLLDSNLFHLIRQRPYNKVANPDDIPRDIFISCINSSPLTPDLEHVLENQINQFQSGLNILSKLTEGDVFVGVQPDSVLKDLKNVRCFSIKGPHPSGNVGIQIHHISPIKPGDIIWTVNAQDVVTLGNLFLKGEYDPSKVITIGGPGIKNPKYIRSRTGGSVRSLLGNELTGDPNRIISGDVLTGREVKKNGFLGFYDSSLSVIFDSIRREFLGMLHPGNKKTRYSLSSSFMKFGNASFNFNTSQNGSQRAMVPINAWENVLPMDIYPNALFRAILSNDIEEMEQLGIWECDDEDFALCSFACPSKIDVGAVIRKGLDLMEAEE